MAVSITAILVLTLTLFAFQTKIDFTFASGFVLISLVILVIFGVFVILFRDRILSILLIGGHHKYAISQEEYIFAALSLYLDVIMLFMQILQLIGLSRS
ncbi:hypothetical protein Anas_12240 [Armadillidium nasatum]|uniref:Protein lifeguard 1 n=1 Tax=Armadillidium nasatum TaxID=96803 RepID=A0A5N5TG46_9CRUS|nr:hypothetical protein Anas_12240 [Armadillidium nasatum]